MGMVRERERKMAQHVAELIPDGATLQMGIGAIPDSVLPYLEDRKDLGVHTELFSDGVMHLVEKGVITGARKTLHPGKIIAGFVLGSRELYRWLQARGYTPQSFRWIGWKHGLRHRLQTYSKEA